MDSDDDEKSREKENRKKKLKLEKDKDKDKDHQGEQKDLGTLIRNPNPNKDWICSRNYRLIFHKGVNRSTPPFNDRASPLAINGMFKVIVSRSVNEKLPTWTSLMIL